jgi:hypothetical protein
MREIEDVEMDIGKKCKKKIIVNGRKKIYYVNEK